METIDIQILNRDIRLSYSSLKSFLKSPEHFIAYKKIPFVDTDATIFGKALHCYVLRNNDFENEYLVFDESKRPVPESNFSKKENKIWKEMLFQKAESEEKELISKEDYDKIRDMTDKLLFHEPSKNLLEYTRSEYEKKIEFTRKKLKFLSFIDIQADVFLADLKTTSDAEPKAFQRDIYNYGYDLQTAVYSDAVSNGHAMYGKMKEFYFIAVEKSEPYGISVHRMSEEAQNQAFEEYMLALENFNKCLDDPELFMRTYDFYCSDQVNRVFDVNVPYWKKSLV